MEDKVEWAYKLFEQQVDVDTVVRQNDMIDTIAITKGRGTEGVVTRWGVTRLPRKTHRGLRKVRSSRLLADAMLWRSVACRHTQRQQHACSMLSARAIMHWVACDRARLKPAA